MNGIRYLCGIAMVSTAIAATPSNPVLTISLPGQEAATYHGLWPQTKDRKPVNGVTVLVANVDASGHAKDIYAEWASVPTETSQLAIRVACTWQFHPRIVKGVAKRGLAKFPLLFDPARSNALDFANQPDRKEFVDTVLLKVHATLAEAGPPPPPPPPDDPSDAILRDLPHVTCPDR